MYTLIWVWSADHHGHHHEPAALTLRIIASRISNWICNSSQKCKFVPEKFNDPGRPLLHFADSCGLAGGQNIFDVIIIIVLVLLYRTLFIYSQAKHMLYNQSFIYCFFKIVDTLDLDNFDSLNFEINRICKTSHQEKNVRHCTALLLRVINMLQSNFATMLQSNPALLLRVINMLQSNFATMLQSNPLLVLVRCDMIWSGPHYCTIVVMLIKFN